MTKVIELDSNNLEAYYLRGVAQNDIGNYKSAIADYTKVIEIDAKFTEAYFSRAASKLNLDDYQGALDDYTKVIEIDPNNQKAHDCLTSIISILKK